MDRATMSGDGIKISIVTPCLNAAAFVDEAIRSVLDQGCSDIEHIVVDGGSSDGTLEVLSRYPHLRVIEQRDNGLYEALNRGIDAAKGAFIGHLNADDCFLPGAIARMIDAIREFPGAEMISGTAMVGRNGRDRCGSGIRLEARTLDAASVAFGVPAINSRFMARSLYGRIGLYDICYPRAADREFLLRAIAAGVVNVQIADPVYWYRSHAGSLTIGGNRLAYLSVGREHMDIAGRYLMDDRLTNADLALIKRWHTEGATLELAGALMAGRIGGAAMTFRQAIKIDSLALPRMLWFSVTKMARWVGSGLHV